MKHLTNSLIFLIFITSPILLSSCKEKQPEYINYIEYYELSNSEYNERLDGDYFTYDKQTYRMTSGSTESYDTPFDSKTSVSINPELSDNSSQLHSLQLSYENRSGSTNIVKLNNVKFQKRKEGSFDYYYFNGLSKNGIEVKGHFNLKLFVISDSFNEFVISGLEGEQIVLNLGQYEFTNSPIMKTVTEKRLNTNY